MTHVLRLGALAALLEVRCFGIQPMSSQLPCGLGGFTASPRMMAEHRRRRRWMFTLDEPSALPQRFMVTTQQITRALIGAQAGRLLMLHAAAVSQREVGASFDYVAPP